ncbi:MAG: M23 family metallopeptidase [Proteobacteria bacterium]|nr:M23 family metallopeptidase [Pseudomonadota bacterium]
MLQKPAVALAFTVVLLSSAAFGQDVNQPASQSRTEGRPTLSLPINCQPARDCWLVNFVDVDSGPGVRDYTCGKRSYDGHKGIDLAIRDLTEMIKGVPVVASADGVVKAVRDGMEDIDVTIAGLKSVEGRECGNGLVVRHRGGWETQYCHLRRGSVAVKAGDAVSQGQRLGLVGNSGRAQFPHVHLSVRQGKTVIDPFVGVVQEGGGAKKCGLGPAPLWSKAALAALSVPATALFNAGFAVAAPDPKVARSGLLAAAQLPSDAPALVLWVDMYWVEAGDQLRFSIIGPGGKPITSKTIAITMTQARRFSFVGKKRKASSWPAGSYRGEVLLSRKAGAGSPLRLSVVRVVELR